MEDIEIMECQHIDAVVIIDRNTENIENNNLSQNTSSYDISYHSTPDNSQEPNAIDKQVGGNGVNTSYLAILKQITPQHSNRLYAKILGAKEIEYVIHHWLNEYISNKEQAIQQLYQLYVDLSAYQHVNVTNFLETQENDINELVPYMENVHNTVLSKTGKYFLFIRNKSYKLKREKIEQFIQVFVAMAVKEKIIYDFNLFLKLIKFFKQMSNSSKRPIKHTGVFIALKHQTEIIRIGAKISRKIASVQKILETEENPELIEQLQTKIEKLKTYDGEINKMINFLQYHVFRKNWNYQDPKLHFMREECIAELYIWMEIFPGRYLHNENLNFIMSALTDPNRIVRYTAINVISKIVENFEPVVHSKLVKIIGQISKQIKDVDYNNAILAVDTINIIRRYISIPSNIREVLCKTLYTAYYPLAAACGRYLADFMRDKNGERGEEGLLKLLMVFEKKAIILGFVDRYPFVIEALYDCFPALQNFEIFMKILEEDELNEEDINIWVNILTESVYQTYNGKCSMKREKPRVGKVDPEQVQNINKFLMFSMKTMLTYCTPMQLSKLLILIKSNMPVITMDISN